MAGVDIQVIRRDEPTGIGRARAIRREVFAGEFDVTPAEEFDDLDHEAGTTHLVAVLDGRDVGTVRLVTNSNEPGVVHITRVAVRADARGQGVGRALMEVAEDLAWRAHAVGTPPRVRLALSVMERAVPFYAALGYEIGVERYLEVRIWHRSATKVLPEIG